MSLRGDTLDRGGFLLGVEILCGLPKRLGCAIGRVRTFEGTVCANEEIKRKTSVFNGSNSRGELADDIELKQKVNAKLMNNSTGTM